ncbi:DeoR/GlpR family DNA-binding transcription regulator [Brevibacterium sp. UCMA 11754]|uniref:DeoR/GlpR family DNA-binding transcription regulator n=1 Tax=Brevibacterium sp. UCMA 11754 TaxID=2749198 RepID=UPI001F345904|nr:DeoR/GlpR family DNA-binding transcription regulator [Brevibacterium sp. UCMA 11754]MCF2572018.1 DeoR/GlpR transcriptional regulator [Brevibacterium sp. UCMA 11754]MCF2572266.1 DeoR/GlpR transcriptional regulator [Brevibacterium sp. UCMA 11754]
MSTREDRLDSILSKLDRETTVGVEALSQELKVSLATIRRDLDLLEQRRLVERTHGGATRRAVDYDLSLRYKEAASAEAKAAIARAAVDRITPGSVIGLSGGTTTFMVADALSRRDDLLHDLTIVTNAVDIANRLAIHPGIKVIVCGGVINTSSFELVGSFVDSVLRSIWLDLAFVGVHAISASAGGMTANEDEAYVNRLMAERAERAIVVADSSKYGRRSFASVGGTEVFQAIITDSQLEAVAATELVQAGYEIELAPMHQEGR